MKRLTIIIACSFIPFITWAQDNSNGTIQGDFNLSTQSYYEDPAINAEKVDEFILMNAYSNIRYNKGNFTAGVRFESYLNVLQGFESNFNGNGIPYRFAQYNVNGLDITVGNFYEQFGNGLIFRSYEEKTLGIDNVMDGVRLKYSPLKGLSLKGFVATQRLFWEQGPGIIRGFDADLNLNEAISSLESSKTNAIIGGSFVSRFQDDNNPVFNLPENVAAYAIRSTVNRGKISFNTEYAYKYNDPAGGITYNNFAPGSALMTNLSYSQRGLGIMLEAHRVDNMDYRSKRGGTGKELTLNYIPAISKQHAYTLAAFYPFATQPFGELGFQGEINYTFKKKSKLGGKYGTQVAVNYSRINGLNGGPSELTINRDHTPMFFSVINEELYFRDLNFDLKKKISKKVKVMLNYLDVIYNKDVIEGKIIGKNVHARIGIAEVNYKIKPKHTLRSEFQYLSVDKSYEYYKDQGDWVMGLVEYTFSPHWFFAFVDQYNGGYTSEGKTYEAVHYLNISCGYSKGTNRFELGYGKVREGIFCVGGVCRNVPSSNGFTLNITSSF
ncbi:MAG TPA: hypothetical protein DCR01_01250 [Flavobacteriales bacterium]|nr:hypothetical protein [Flavobacteriales bacterium]|tara:strand:+ start:2217 stop:3875 length:1659 start_codon:yes stop_codon:yes gene_type:complete